MSLGQSLVVVLTLIALFALALAGTVAVLMSRPPRGREPGSLLPPRRESLLPPRRQAPLRAVPHRVAAHKPSASTGGVGRAPSNHRHDGRAAA